MLNAFICKRLSNVKDSSVRQPTFVKYSSKTYLVFDVQALISLLPADMFE